MDCIISYKILFGLIFSQAIATNPNATSNSVLNIAIIGAGQSGLCSAKHAIAQGFNVTVYEQTENIGGIWQYTDEVGKNQYGVNVHSSIYQGMRTNAPYQVMEYPDFHYPNNTISYPPHSDVLNYLHSYADHFDLKKHIQFSHLVIRILPIDNRKWEIIVRNLRQNTFETRIFDSVFVANGHYSTPFIPDIPGALHFKGKMIHSHDFRTAHTFYNNSVLVIGGGVSGRDIIKHLSVTAKRITFSQHKRSNETAERNQRQRSYSPKVILQDNVQGFTLTGAKFIDDSYQTFDVVIYATGYNYTFPFLSVDSGIHIDSNYVQPLYKHIFNIEHPTMAFFGITSGIATSHMLDLQVRFALKFITGTLNLPSKSEMLTDTQIQSQIHWNQGYRKHRSHSFGPEARDYLKTLVEIANVTEIPDVLIAIGLDSLKASRDDPSEFRNYRYEIVDDKTFRKEKYTTTEIAISYLTYFIYEDVEMTIRSIPQARM